MNYIYTTLFNAQGKLSRQEENGFLFCICVTSYLCDAAPSEHMYTARGRMCSVEIVIL